MEAMTRSLECSIAVCRILAQTGHDDVILAEEFLWKVDLSVQIPNLDLQDIPIGGVVES